MRLSSLGEGLFELVKRKKKIERVLSTNTLLQKLHGLSITTSIDITIS